MLVQDVATYLQNNGIGTLGTNLFVGRLPDEPDTCTAVFAYAGFPMPLHWNGEQPGLQVLVRAPSYVQAQNLMEQIRGLLHGLSEQTLGTTRYLLVRAKQSPMLLQRDDGDRAIFVCNFDVIKELG